MSASTDLLPRKLAIHVKKRLRHGLRQSDCCATDPWSERVHIGLLNKVIDHNIIL